MAPRTKYGVVAATTADKEGGVRKAKVMSGYQGPRHGGRASHAVCTSELGTEQQEKNDQGGQRNATEGNDRITRD
jgi:hypothetical protein